MSSFLDFEGVYDKQKRYMVNNWSPEDFTQHFGAESVYNDTKLVVTQPAYDLKIKAGEMRELGQFEAYMVTRHFVNREMMRDAQKKEGKERERIEMAMNNKEARKPYEDKTIQEVIAGEESTFMKSLKDKMRAEIQAESKEEVKKPETKKEEVKKDKTAEFAGV